MGDLTATAFAMAQVFNLGCDGTERGACGDQHSCYSDQLNQGKGTFVVQAAGQKRMLVLAIFIYPPIVMQTVAHFRAFYGLPQRGGILANGVFHKQLLFHGR